jgi:hypothetical protein
MIKSLRDYRHVVRDRNRHGKERYYFRAGHGRRIRIHEPLATEGFELRYHELMRQHEANAIKRKPARGTATPNTLRWLGTQYTTSAEFGQLSPRTQHVTKLILESIYLEPIAPDAKEVFADCPVSLVPGPLASSATARRPRLRPPTIG